MKKRERKRSRGRKMNLTKFAHNCVEEKETSFTVDNVVDRILVNENTDYVVDETDNIWRAIRWTYLITNLKNLTPSISRSRKTQICIINNLTNFILPTRLLSFRKVFLLH